MRNARAVVGLPIGLLLGAALLTGCSTPAPSPDPMLRARALSPASAPVFASDEEALAAAEAAYARYVEVVDQVFIDGGANPERMEEVATGEYLQVALAGFETVRSAGWRSTGGTVFRDLSLQDYSVGRGTDNQIAVYVCEDISAVDVIDANGVSVVSPDRPPSTLFAATLDASGEEWVLSSHEVWSDQAC